MTAKQPNSQTAKQLSFWALTWTARRWLAMLVVVSACSAPTEEESLPLRQRVAEGGDAGNAATGADVERTQCGPSAQRLVLIDTEKVGNGWVVLRLTNRHKVVAQLQVVATSFGDNGRVQTVPVAVSLAGDSSTTLTVRLSAAELATRLDIRGGRVQFSVDAVFADGRRDAHVTPPVYYAFGERDEVVLSASSRFTEAHLTDLGRSRGLTPSNALEVALLDPDFADESAPDVRGNSTVEQRLLREPIEGAKQLAAANVTLCFKIKTTYLDSTGNEDQWGETTPTARPAIGNKINLGGTVYYLGWQTSGRGCVVTNKSNMTLSLTIFSTGTIDTHTLRVVDNANSTGVATKTITTPASGTQNYTIELGDQGSDELEHNIYMAAALPIAYHRGLGTGTLKIVENGSTDTPPRSYYSTGTGIIYLAGGMEGIGFGTGDSYEKYTIAHEVGHWIMEDSGVVYGSGVYVGEPEEDCSGTFGTTGIGDEKWQFTAMAEGFATFYAGDGFNSDSGAAPDCWARLGEAAESFG